MKISLRNDLDAYVRVGKEYMRKEKEWEEFSKRNPEEDVSKEDWIISTLITDLLVARGEIDKSYIERYNF